MTSRDVKLWFITCGYIGYLPYAPGTYASILACLLLYFFPLFGNPITIAVFTAAGIFCITASRTEEKDPGYVVIDELIGMFIAVAGHVPTPLNLIKGFILFRTFDILKPYPIRRIERLPGAYGIIMDDVFAGALANVVLVIWAKVV